MGVDLGSVRMLTPIRDEQALQLLREHFAGLIVHRDLANMLQPEPDPLTDGLNALLKRFPLSFWRGSGSYGGKLFDRLRTKRSYFYRINWVRVELQIDAS